MANGTEGDIMGIEQEYEAVLKEFNALKPDDAKALQEFYDNTVFPKALERMRAIADRKGLSREPVDALVLTTGKQPYSIMLSLKLTPARFVALLCTDESLPKAEHAVAKIFGTGTAEPARLYPPVQAADPGTVYRQILNIYRERQPASIVIDITSGTKAMTAAASSAAVVVGARQRYVESDGTTHRGFFCREEPHELRHPLTEMGDLRREEAERLFDRGAYEQAASLFDELHRIGAPGFRFEERARLARAYAEADSLRFAEAVAAFGERDLERLRNRGDSIDPLCDAAGRLERQRKRLEELASKAPADETLLRYLVAYARRRAGQGLHDAAALVQYRTIELCIGARLAARGIDKDAVTGDAIAAATQGTAEDALARYNELAGSSEHRLEQWPGKLALAQGWTLLRVLDDPLARCVDPNRLFGQITARNESIFAHGRKPLSEHSYRHFVELAALVRATTAGLQSWNLPDPDEEFDFYTFQAKRQG